MPEAVPRDASNNPLKSLGQREEILNKNTNNSHSETLRRSERIKAYRERLKQIETEIEDQRNNANKTILEMEVEKFFKTTNKKNPVINRGWKPRTLNECWNCPDEEWIAAANKEIDGMTEDNVFEKINIKEVPEGSKIIRLLNMFVIKEDGKKKMRCCVMGNQRNIDDIGLKDASVVFKTPLKILLVIATKQQSNLDFYDFVGAFRTTPVAPGSKPIYCYIPTGWKNVTAEEQRTMVFKLNKVLYGVQEATREFQLQHEKLLMDKFKFIQSEVDRCVFYKLMEDGRYLFIMSHVDDNLVISNGNDGKNLIDEIKLFYKITNGVVDVYVGWKLRLNYDRTEIYLNQQNYIDEICEKYGKIKETKISSPALANEDWTIEKPEDEDVLLEVPYQSLLATLNYLTNSIPEILTAVNKLSSFSNKPKRKHWNALKRIWDYVVQNKEDYILFKYIKNKKILEAYADSSLGSEVNGRSRMGGLIRFHGNTIWTLSKAIKNHPVSTAEAETYALSETFHNVVYVESFLKSIEYDLEEPTVIFGDNQASLTLSSSEKNLDRSKYFKLRIASLKQAINEGRIELKWIDTDRNVADVFTKIISGKKFEDFKNILKNKDIQVGGVLDAKP